MPTAPTVNTGERSTGVAISQDRRVIDMRDKIYQYDPDTSPFLTVLSESGRVRAVKAGNPVFKHLEDQPLPAWNQLAEALDTTETAVDVDNGEYFKGGDLVLIASSSLGGIGEIMKVVSVASDVLTVIRNFTGDGVTGGTALDDATIQIIGNVNEELAGAPAIKSTTETTVTNYTQIIRNRFGASETLGGSDLYGGPDRAYQTKKEGTQHAFLTERAFLFSGPKEATGTGGHKERSTGGMFYWTTTNIDDAGGPLVPATLETWCESLFRYSKAPKLVLQSRRAATQIDLIAEGRLETVPRADTYGVSVKRFVSSHGELLLHTHDMFINDFAGSMLAVDLENVMKRFMNDSKGRARDAMLKTNIQDNDVDGWNDEYLSELGLHVTLEAAHGVLEGITAT